MEQDKYFDENKDALELHQKWKEQEEPQSDEPPKPEEFNFEEVGLKFDAENAEIVIPDEVVDDVDNDWVLTE